MAAPIDGRPRVKAPAHSGTNVARRPATGNQSSDRSGRRRTSGCRGCLFLQSAAPIRPSVRRRRDVRIKTTPLRPPTHTHAHTHTHTQTQARSFCGLNAVHRVTRAPDTKAAALIAVSVSVSSSSPADCFGRWTLDVMTGESAHRSAAAAALAAAAAVVGAGHVLLFDGDDLVVFSLLPPFLWGFYRIGPRLIL